MSSKENLQIDPFQEVEKELQTLIENKIRNYLLPLQTKKLSRKTIEQIAQDCALQIAADSVVISRKASSRYATQVTEAFSQILKTQNLPTTPVFNDELIEFARKLSPQDHETASRVVSRVYQSLFEFALQGGLKAFASHTQSSLELPIAKKE